MLEHNVGDHSLGILDEGIEHCIFKSRGCRPLCIFLHPLLHIRPELLSGFKVGGVLCKVIVKLRQLLDADAVDLDLEGGRLAGKIGHLVILREGDADFKLLADAVADELILKARDELTAADGQREALALAAVKCNAVNKALKVHIDLIPVLYRTVIHGNDSCISLTQHINLCVDLVISHILDLFRRLYALVLRNGNLRLGDAGGLDDNAVFLADGGNLNLGSVHQDQLGFLNGVCQLRTQQAVDGILIEHALAVDLLDHLPGCLALPEALQGNVLLLLLVGLLHCVLKHVSGNLKGKLLCIHVNFLG